MKQITKIWLFLALILSVNTVWAGPLVQEDYPWANLPSMTFGSNGVNPGSGTLEWTYANINPAEFDELWWTPVNLGIGLSGFADSMTGASLSGGIATYTGSTSWTDPDDGIVYSSVQTRIEIEIVALSLVSAAPIAIMNAGLSPGTFAIDVSGLTDFTVRFTAEALDPRRPGLGWLAVNDFNQAQGSQGLSQTSVGATFFRSAPSSVPEPASLALLGIGLLGLGFGKRKK